MIRVLGPLEVGGDGPGGPVEVGSPRHREVLAALVVDAGRVVSTDALLERVWGDVTRGGTTANLQAIISRLRTRLRDVPGVDIATVSPGYRLDVAPDAVDAGRFLEALAEARRLQAAGEPGAARSRADEALREWRGSAYADVPLPFAEAEAARLEGQRLAANELVAELDLALGREEEVLARVPALVAEHPLREGLRGVLMTALYRAGRQADALAEYDAVRRELADELGLDPGPELQRLHQRILEQDAGLLSVAESPVASPVPVAASPAHAAAVPVRPRPVTLALTPDDPLVGRDGEVEYLVSLLAGTAQRLVTLTGVGGVGKTRLALAVVGAVADAFPDGAAVVPLAALTDPALVLPEVGRALGLSGGEEADPLTALVDHLRSRRLLLVLDNAEHLLDAAPQVSRLVASCPGLTVLVTSRTVLRVRGEVQYQVPPLALPDPEAVDAAEVGGAAAVRLFLERARTTAPDFALRADDPDATAAVGALCRRLAGIPLALELAAARVRLMSPAALLERLDVVLAGGGARDLPPRQRTMRATLDWSHDLLDPAEQRLFRRLGVFAGGFTLEAVEQVAVLPGEDALEVLGLLEALVEHSLVVPEADGREPRFRMLEPIAQYAVARLTGPDVDPAEVAAVRAAHRTFFRDLVHRLEPTFRGPGTTDGLARAEREHANLVAALESALTDDPELAGWLLWDLWLFWWLKGYLVEGRRIAGAVLEQPDGAISDEVRARVAAVHAAMAFAQSDLEPAAASWALAREVGERSGDLEGLAYGTAGAGLSAIALGDLPVADEALRATVPLCEAVGKRGGWLWTLAHVWLATVTLLSGDPDGARPLVARAVGAARERRDVLATYICLFTAAQIEIAVGNPEGARPPIEEGVVLSLETGDLANLAYLLEALSVVESAAGRHRRVAELRGSAARLRDVVGAVVYGYYQPDEDSLRSAADLARAELGEQEWTAALAAGRALEVEEVVALATAAQPVG